MTAPPSPGSHNDAVVEPTATGFDQTIRLPSNSNANRSWPGRKYKCSKMQKMHKTL